MRRNKGSILLVLGSNIPRDKIISITFLDKMKDLPEDAWDVSAESDGSVQAYTSKNGSYYNLYIAADGDIIAPSDCSYLFSSYTNLKQFNLNDNFNTNSVQSMQYMFDCCRSLTELNLSSLDTSNVTDMNHMFYNCDKLNSINIQSFNTSNVTDMSYMFNFCAALSNLQLNNSFDVSSVNNHLNFMSPGGTVNGKPWEEFFAKATVPDE